MKTIPVRQIAPLTGLVLLGIAGLMWWQIRQEAGEATTAPGSERTAGAPGTFPIGPDTDRRKTTRHQREAFRQLQHMLADKRADFRPDTPQSEAGPTNQTARADAPQHAGPAGFNEDNDRRRFDFVASADGERVQGSHPRQPFAVSISSEDVRISLRPRTTPDLPEEPVDAAALELWGWDLKLAGYGRGGRFEDAEPGSLSSSGPRAEIRRGPVTEWYIQEEQGLEQGFTIAERPLVKSRDSAPLRIEFEVNSSLELQNPGDPRCLQFASRDGASVLTYDQLLVNDAQGRDLAARLAAVDSSSFALVIDDHSAAYPIVVDPVMSVMLVKDINTATQSSNPGPIVELNGLAFFPANVSGHGFELWKSDGTEAGTVLLEDILPGPNSSNPQNLIQVGDRLFFTANDGMIGEELWMAMGLTGPSGLILDLIDNVATLNLSQGLENSLDAKLDAARRALEDVNANNDVAAVNAMNAFINAVEAQRGNKIPEAEADALIAAALDIIATLEEP